MSDIAIRADRLSKRYDITALQARHNSLRDELMEGLKSLVRRNGCAPAGQTAVWALRDVSFEVRPGEVIGIIGRNGAGKSTLLKLLSRITEPTGGRAEIYGRVGSLLEVGTGFIRELSGRENIYLSGAILGMRKAEIDRKFDEIVAFAEVEPFIDTPVKRYSSGMYLRLAFAVAAHLEPEILVVDEVLAVGDASFQKKCLGKMGEAGKGGRTVLFVSHSMATIENLCRRVILLRDGAIAEDGPTRQVISRYLDDIADLSDTALSARTDRSGRGEIVAVALEFRDEAGKRVAYPVSGQTLIVRLRYRGQPGGVFRNCRVSVSIRKDDRVYFLMSTELVDKRQLDLAGDGYIDFVVPELPLSQGVYQLESYIESHGVMQDWVLGAARISVVDGDFYGTGKNYPPGWQGATVLVKHSWTCGTEPSVA